MKVHQLNDFKRICQVRAAGLHYLSLLNNICSYKLESVVRENQIRDEENSKYEFFICILFGYLYL